MSRLERFENIDAGWRGTERTIEVMGQLATAAARDWGFIRIATPFAAGCARDFRCQGQRVLDWTKKKISYIPDPLTTADEHGVVQGIELVQAPLRTIQRGGGDCIPLGEKIILRHKASGQYAARAIGDLRETFGEYEALSYAVNEKSWVFSPITQWQLRGRRPIQNVIMRSGQKFSCTPDHKVWGLFTERFEPRRQPLSEITTWSKGYMRGLMFAHKIPALGSVAGISPAQVFVEGLFAAEGYAEKPFKSEISNKNAHLIDHTCACLDELGIPHRRRLRKDGVSLVYIKASWLSRRLHGLFGGRAYTKRFPEEYLSVSREAMELLLDAYGKGDAYIPKPGSVWFNRTSKIYNTSSSELAQQLILMHMILGRPVSPWYQPHPRGAGRVERPMWRVICKDIPGHRGHRERQPGVENACIKRIDDAGETEVCDISVEGTRNFVTQNGAVVSNCDDQSSLIAAMALALGIPARFATLKCDPERPAEYSHVYPVLFIDGQWLGADATVRDSHLGWEPKRYLEKRLWRI